MGRDSGHSHHYHHVGEGCSHRPLLLALVLTLSFAVVEAVAGWWSGSLALLGDAGHMATDSLSLGLAAGAALLARRPPSERHSYGLGRAETLAAFVNAVLMIAVVVIVSIEAVARLRNPPPVAGGTVTFVALIGLLVNLGSAWLLAGRQENLNVKAALLHVIGDLLGSVAALVSGIVIVATGWTPVDPLLSLLIVTLILLSAIRVLHEAVHALMEGVPLYLDVEQIGRSLAEHEGIHSVHDLHIWSLSAERTALSAHLVIGDIAEWERLLPRVRSLLSERFGIEHVTLQPESMVQHVSIAELTRPGESRDAAWGKDKG